MKNTKTYLISVGILLFSCALTGQNLIPNQSFEDNISCPDNTAQLNAPSILNFWTKPTNHDGTPDYYHTCANPSLVGVPSNLLGIQIPSTGNGYMGFYA